MKKIGKKKATVLVLGFPQGKCSLSPLLLIQTDDVGNDRGQKNPSDDCSRNLPGAVGPLALDFTGARINQYPIDPVMETIRAQPHRKQEVLESDLRVLRIYRLDVLLVGFDVAGDTRPDGLRHDFSRLLESLRQCDLIALRPHKVGGS